MPETGVSALEGDLRRRGAWDEPDELEDLRSSESDRLRSSESDLLARHPRPTRSASASPRPVRSAPLPKGRVEGRRTVTIQGHGAERYYPAPSRRRPPSRPYERPGFRPDRVAMWAVLLGFVLVLVAAATSHAAILVH